MKYKITNNIGIDVSSVLLLFALSLLLSACTLAKVQVDVVSERTALENQVLGSYNAIDREMLLTASVRGVDSKGEIRKPPQRSPEQKDAMMAMRTLSFHEDDTEAFKRLGWAGENMNGLLTTFPVVKSAAPDDLKDFAEGYSEEEFNEVIRQVNEARMVVMQRVIDVNEEFSDSDLPEIQRVFGKINREKALPGEKIQNEDSSWIVKK